MENTLETSNGVELELKVNGDLDFETFDTILLHVIVTDIDQEGDNTDEGKYTGYFFNSLTVFFLPQKKIHTRKIYSNRG